MPGPVLQLVDLETLTVGFSEEDFSFSVLAVGEGGFGVGVAGSIEAVDVEVSVAVWVSAGVVVSVATGVWEGVFDGVKVGGGSSVGVKVDLMWKGVLVEVPFIVYFGAV
jgi:hypothetical protein